MSSQEPVRYWVHKNQLIESKRDPDFGYPTSDQIEVVPLPAYDALARELAEAKDRAIKDIDLSVEVEKDLRIQLAAAQTELAAEREKVKGLGHVTNCARDVLKYEILAANAKTVRATHQFKMNCNDAKSNLCLALKRVSMGINVKTGEAQ